MNMSNRLALLKPALLFVFVVAMPSLEGCASAPNPSPDVSNLGASNNSDDTLLRSPIPPGRASLKIGRELYEDNCLPCHGPRGGGDGPVAANLNPKPTDLATHAGMHQDFYFFWWITYGIEGTSMPSFEDGLTEEQRWHIVNYIKTLSRRR